LLYIGKYTTVCSLIKEEIVSSVTSIYRFIVQKICSVTLQKAETASSSSSSSSPRSQGPLYFLLHVSKTHIVAFLAVAPKFRDKSELLILLPLLLGLLLLLLLYHDYYCKHHYYCYYY